MFLFASPVFLAFRRCSFLSGLEGAQWCSLYPVFPRPNLSSHTKFSGKGIFLVTSEVLWIFSVLMDLLTVLFVRLCICLLFSLKLASNLWPWTFVLWWDTLGRCNTHVYSPPVRAPTTDQNTHEGQMWFLTLCTKLFMKLSLTYLICLSTGEVAQWGRALSCSHRGPVPNNHDSSQLSVTPPLTHLTPSSAFTRHCTHR